MVGAGLPTAGKHKTMKELTPKEIVAALDRHIVGQAAAKRAAAIAIRNRWRRQQLPDAMRNEVGPANMVTSILGDYRGYDTMGETVVIFAAALCVLLLLRPERRRRREDPSS